MNDLVKSSLYFVFIVAAAIAIGFGLNWVREESGIPFEIFYARPVYIINPQ